MKLSELENILKEYRENYGDIEISFGKVDENGDSYCSCEVEIEIDRIYSDLNITVI